MKKILASLAMFSLVLVGCGGGGNSAAVVTDCSIDVEGMSINLEITETDKKISGLVATYEIATNGVEITDEQKEQFKETMEKQYGEYEGLEFKYTFEEEVILMDMIFNLDKLDKLPAEFGGITGSDIASVDTEEFTKGIEESGFSCEAAK